MSTFSRKRGHQKGSVVLLLLSRLLAERLVGKAIEHYEKFLSLWKDADPGISELEDARERLAGLKSKRP